MSKKIKVFLAATLLNSLALSTPKPANGVPLNCGETVKTKGILTNANSAQAEFLLIERTRPFAFPLSSGKRVTGKLQDRVAKSQVLGTLFFSYTIFVDSSSSGSIVSVSRDSFKQFSALADWREDGVGTVAPTEAMRTLNCSQIKFNFAGQAVAPGESSRLFFVLTNAPSFNGNGTATLTITDGKQLIPFTLQTYQPTR